MLRIKFAIVGFNLGGYVIPSEIESPVPFSVVDKVKHYNSDRHNSWEVFDVSWVIDDCGGGFYQSVSQSSHSLSMKLRKP